MITPETYPAHHPEKITWFYALIFIFGFAIIAGRQAIAWFLIKLYEFFIQKNPIQL